MKFTLIFLIFALLPMRAKCQMRDTDEIDIKRLNVYGNPQQIVIREETLDSSKNGKIERFNFNTIGHCTEYYKKCSNGAQTTETTIKYRYSRERLECVNQIECIGQISDTLTKEYIYTDEGLLKQKTNYHMLKGKLKRTEYTTYKIDSVDSKTILAEYYLLIGENNGVEKFKKYTDRFRYNSNNQIDYFSADGIDYRILYDSIRKEIKTFQCLGQDSVIISIQKYDKYGNEIERVSPINCGEEENHTNIDKSRISLNNPFINYCINECELKMANNDYSSQKNIIYTFYQYDELKNIKLKFTYDACSGYMCYITYDYIFF